LSWRWGWHLLPALVWAVNAVTWFYQPVEFHYNSFIHAYHPELPYVTTRLYIPHDFTSLRPYVSELVLTSVLIYSALTLYRLVQAYRLRGYRFWHPAPEPLSTLRTFVLLNLVLPLLITGVKLRFREDLGDYLLACYVTGIIYVTCYLLMRGSDFYREPLPELASDAPTEPKKKYEKSALTNDVEDELLGRLNQLLLTEKPHLDSTLSLPKLAAQLRISPHHLSQLLNDRLGQTFFDWLAMYRVAEAQRLLTDPTTAHLKIDDIAERVGYNATSAFHTAFKRITSQTPAQFRDANRSAAGSSRSARSS
jgi:AraC-like DNA-binding protein